MHENKCIHVSSIYMLHRAHKLTSDTGPYTSMCDQGKYKTINMTLHCLYNVRFRDSYGTPVTECIRLLCKLSNIITFSHWFCL